MKISEYYRGTATISLNGSIAALIPTIIIITGNLSFFKSKEIMLFTLPFLIYSFISFQIYLFRIRQSLSINRNMAKSESRSRSLFAQRNLLVLFMNTNSSRILLYFPDGHLAGIIKKHREKGGNIFKNSKTYALYTVDDQSMGFFKVKGRKSIKIEVYDQCRNFLGSFEKKNLGWRRTKKELLDANGRYIGAVEGSSAFMDEQVLNTGNQLDCRLRRGLMPLEWSGLFPEANTPVLSFRESLTEQDKLLRMSFLINEFFIER